MKKSNQRFFWVLLLLFALALPGTFSGEAYGNGKPVQNVWEDLESSLEFYESMYTGNFLYKIMTRYNILTSFNGTAVYFDDVYEWEALGSLYPYSPIVNLEGRGDLLLFPLFYADSNVKTKIRIVNVDENWGIVAKVVLRSSRCSEELRDFLIYLSPGDVWIADIVIENGKVVLRSTDDSVIVPSNHKVASQTNPFVIALREPTNPEDTNKFGYLEVMALAKVNWQWTDGSKTFTALAHENGFENLHEFMRYLYNPTDPYLYNSLAYCPGNGNRLAPNSIRGLIVPFAYNILTSDGEYDADCDGRAESEIYPTRSPLYGTAEIVIPGGYAAYRATAIDGFVALGTELKVCDSEEYPCRVTYAETYRDPARGVYSYKVGAAIDTPLNYVGVVDLLDLALLKREIHVPYYDPDDEDSCGSFVILFSPTMQTKYVYDRSRDKHICDVQKHISSIIWSHVWSNVISGTLGIAVHSFDNFENRVFCEFSPCLMKPYELYFIGPVDSIFDPFAYSEGWMKLLLPRVRFEEVKGYDCEEGSCSPAGDYDVLVGGLPVIPLAAFYNSEGLTFVEPSFKETYIAAEEIGL